jgi:hypothetical protein
MHTSSHNGSSNLVGRRMLGEAAGGGDDDVDDAKLAHEVWRIPCHPCCLARLYAASLCVAHHGGNRRLWCRWVGVAMMVMLTNKTGVCGDGSNGRVCRVRLL